MTLRGMSAEMMALWSMPIEGDDEAAFGQLLDGLKGSVKEKSEAILDVVCQLDADAVMLKDEEERLAKMRRRMEAKRAKLVEYLRFNLESIGYGVDGIKDFKLDKYRLSWRKNPPACNIVNEEAVPPQYLIPQPPRIDKYAILQALKDGEEVPGAAIERKDRMVWE